MIMFPHWRIRHYNITWHSIRYIIFAAPCFNICVYWVVSGDNNKYLASLYHHKHSQTAHSQPSPPPHFIYFSWCGLVWFSVVWEHKTHHGPSALPWRVWLSCSPSIRSNWKYQIINMILHGWIIREMVGVIPRYCPAATGSRDLSGLQGEDEEERLRMEDRMWSRCDDWELWSHSRGETWDRSSLALRLASHRQCSPDQFSAVWVAARDKLYLYNNINNNNTRLLIFYLYRIVPSGIVTAPTMITLLIVSL